MTGQKLPNSRVNLDKAIERAFGRGDAALRTRTILADVIVAQMIPEGVIKGGSSLKMRYGSQFIAIYQGVVCDSRSSCSIQGC